MWKSPWNPMLWLDRGRFSSQPDAPRPLVVQAASVPKSLMTDIRGRTAKKRSFMVTFAEVGAHTQMKPAKVKLVDHFQAAIRRDLKILPQTARL